MAPLPNTGERMIPESTDAGTFIDHIIRYRFACKYINGKRVLDIACGEGYGTAALASGGARHVIGIDISPETVSHARRKYNIDARVGTAERIDLPDSSIDVVVSFETIEHLAHPVAFLREIARILTPNGLLILSTPNKKHASDADVDNPFHNSEMTEDEFRKSMEEVFESVQYYSQGLIETSLLSTRALAALHTRPKFRPLSGLIFRIRRWLCSEHRRPLSLKHRVNPIQAITQKRPTLFDQVFDPNQIRLIPIRSRDDALFFLAVASCPRTHNSQSEVE